MISVVDYQKAVRKLETELILSENHFECKSKFDNEEEIQKLKEQIAYKDKIIDDLKHFKNFTNQEIESKEMKIMEQALRIKELQEENELKNSIIKDHHRNKSRLDALYKILPILKQKHLKNQEDIKMHLKNHEEERTAFKIEKNNMEIELLQLKKELNSEKEYYQNIIEENESYKKQLAENETVIRELDRENRSTSDIIDNNLQLIKEREDLQTQLETADMKTRATKRKHEEEILTLQRKAVRLEQDCDELGKTKEKNLKLMQSIKDKDKIIERQKTNVTLLLDEIKKKQR